MEADAKHFEDVMRVNYIGTVHTLKAVLPGMVERGHGHAAVTNSIGGCMGKDPLHHAPPGFRACEMTCWYNYQYLHNNDMV